MVVTEPPLIAVVPLPLLKLAADTAPVIVLVPLVVILKAPKAVPEPTVLANVTPPLPLEILNARALLLPTVDLNHTKLFVVVNVVSAPKVTAPL